MEISHQKSRTMNSVYGLDNAQEEISAISSSRFSAIFNLVMKSVGFGLHNRQEENRWRVATSIYSYPLWDVT